MSLRVRSTVAPLMAHPNNSRGLRKVSHSRVQKSAGWGSFLAEGLERGCVLVGGVASIRFNGNYHVAN